MQHHKKQGCFGIKIPAFRCQIELSEIKVAPFGVQRITGKEVIDDALKLPWSPIYDQAKFIFVWAVFWKVYFCLSCILKVVLCNLSSAVLRLGLTPRLAFPCLNLILLRTCLKVTSTFQKSVDWKYQIHNLNTKYTLPYTKYYSMLWDNFVTN